MNEITWREKLSHTTHINHIGSGQNGNGNSVLMEWIECNRRWWTLSLMFNLNRMDFTVYQIKWRTNGSGQIHGHTLKLNAHDMKMQSKAQHNSKWSSMHLHLKFELNWCQYHIMFCSMKWPFDSKIDWKYNNKIMHLINMQMNMQCLLYGKRHF